MFSNMYTVHVQESRQKGMHVYIDTCVHSQVVKKQLKYKRNKTKQVLICAESTQTARIHHPWYIWVLYRLWQLNVVSIKNYDLLITGHVMSTFLSQLLYLNHYNFIVNYWWNSPCSITSLLHITSLLSMVNITTKGEKEILLGRCKQISNLAT